MLEINYKTSQSYLFSYFGKHKLSFGKTNPPFLTAGPWTCLRLVRARESAVRQNGSESRGSWSSSVDWGVRCQWPGVILEKRPVEIIRSLSAWWGYGSVWPRPRSMAPERPQKETRTSLLNASCLGNSGRAPETSESSGTLWFGPAISTEQREFKKTGLDCWWLWSAKPSQ